MQILHNALVVTTYDRWMMTPREAVTQQEQVYQRWHDKIKAGRIAEAAYWNEVFCDCDSCDPYQPPVTEAEYWEAAISD